MLLFDAVRISMAIQVQWTETVVFRPAITTKDALHLNNSIGKKRSPARIVQWKQLLLVEQNHNTRKMKNENEVLANFQVEELEKRYEMGWGRRKYRDFDPDDYPAIA